MALCRWFSKSEVKVMLEESTGGRKAEAGQDAIVVPGAHAIAHHLIKGWCDQATPENNNKLPFRMKDFVTGSAFGVIVAMLLSKM